MKITEALLAEHVVFHNLFDYLERTTPRLRTLAEVRALAGLLDAMLHAHGQVEDKLVMEPLDHCLDQFGQNEVIHAEHDHIETVESLWVTPHDALRRMRAGELLMLPPTVANLEFLAAHESVESVIAAARTVGVPPRILPKVRWTDDGRIDALLMPSDPGYDEIPER